MKLSKRFLKCGWTPMPGGDLSRGKGSATMAFLFTGPNRHGTWRIVAGKRITRIERREHGTPTGRCSRGHWIVEWKGDSPLTLREWGSFGDFAAWFVKASPDERASWTWTDYPLGDLNYCHEKAVAGRGRTLRGMPGNTGTLGYAPATGRKAATHCPKRINRAKAAEKRRRDNLRWLADMNARDARIQAERDGRSNAHRAVSAMFTK